MKNYNLGFISNEDIFSLVKNTVLKYNTKINRGDSNKNFIDPIKLIFDSKIYGCAIDVVAAESFRQIEQNNGIDYFHQHLFDYVGNGWTVPNEGFDVVNDELHIYVMMKNKNNTTNSAVFRKTYMKMQYKLVKDKDATCMLVEPIANMLQNTWVMTVDNEQLNNPKIQRVSLDKFYEIVFGEADAFMKLSKALPDVLDDVISDMRETK